MLQLINKLGKVNFQPGSEEGSDVRAELTSEIHENLKQQEEDLELLRQEIEDATTGPGVSAKRRDSEREKDKTRLNIQVAKLGEDLKQYVIPRAHLSFPG